MALVIGASADFGGGNVATGPGKGDGLGRGWVRGGFDEVVGVDAGVCEQPADNVGIVVAVVGHLGHGAFADVLIAGEAGVACAMDGRRPQRVVALSVAIGLGEPLF